MSFFDFDQRARRLDDIDWTAEPSHKEVTETIEYSNGRDSFWETGTRDTFAVRAVGEVTVEAGGSYDFRLTADDGAALWINGEQIVDHDGLHGYRAKTGEIDLEPGTTQSRFAT